MSWPTGAEAGLPAERKNLDWWASDQIALHEVKRFDWFRGYHVAPPLMWGRQSYRWSDFDLRGNSREGIAVDWPTAMPISAPGYITSSARGISGSRERMAHLPDGQFQPPWRSLRRGDYRRAVAAAVRGRRRIIPAHGEPDATLRTLSLPSTQCLWLGCPYGGTSARSLPRCGVMATGPAPIRSRSSPSAVRPR